MMMALKVELAPSGGVTIIDKAMHLGGSGNSRREIAILREEWTSCLP
jgi:hypothetical protein